MSFTFSCGCMAETVGQDFADGVLVCPIHGEPLAPYEHATPEWSGRLRLDVLLAAEKKGTVQAYADEITAGLIGNGLVREVLSTLEEVTA